MIPVILSHPNNQRQAVLLAGVPRVGDHLRLAASDIDDPSLVVEHVLWVEVSRAMAEPSVILVVRPHINGPHV